ncbi:MAG: type II toxin-antitoxin system MqsA family antitoxin [Ignavibacteriaceae bacterium]|nr:type II toxin-antitoxin system MqsA family antitoxin [Ignavibacteriaceae bacterium]
MKCMICKTGETVKGNSVVTLNRDGMVIVFKSVPAEICNNCGEVYVNNDITKNLLDTAEEVSKSGVQVDIREFKAA